jgi:hypothetical protein
MISNSTLLNSCFSTVILLTLTQRHAAYLTSLIAEIEPENCRVGREAATRAYNNNCSDSKAASPCRWLAALPRRPRTVFSDGSVELSNGQ